MMMPLLVMFIFVFFAIRSCFDSRTYTAGGMLLLLSVAVAFYPTLDVRKAHADFTGSCPSAVGADELLINMTDNECSLASAPGPNTDFSEDIIAIQNFGASNVNFLPFYDETTDPRVLTYTINGNPGPNTGTVGTRVYDCSAGCLIEGTHGGVPFTSFIYTNSGGTGTYAANVAAPTVSSVSPATGPAVGGTSVTITGTNFSGATAVAFGATAAAGFTVDSATQITATSPAGSGTVDVRVTTAGGVSATSAADEFTYVAAPTVSS
ncbi:IPT/TIG domain-containing protein, partial [uncultured Hoeflea sp.]|uniref:IPT/TIG domain-containing protein n=1 Tax=uncultured Hoeflea sp. TaxID=538666 RepID=UPI0030DCBAC5